MKIEQIERDENLKRRILVVEDDEENAFMTKNTLKNFFDINFVKSGYEALEEVNNNKYDAVLMDINLGDMNMNGLRTLQLIKQDSKHKHLKVFAMTEFSNAREWYVKNGFEDMFAKPILYKKIVTVINDSIAGNRISESLFLKAS